MDAAILDVSVLDGAVLDVPFLDDTVLDVVKLDATVLDVSVLVTYQKLQERGTIKNSNTITSKVHNLQN